MIKSSLCDYSDAYILLKGAITIAPVPPPAVNPNNANDIDVIMPMYNLIENSDNYSKTSCLWEYYRDEPASTDSGAIANFHASNNSDLFKFE